MLRLKYFNKAIINHFFKVSVCHVHALNDHAIRMCVLVFFFFFFLVILQLFIFGEITINCYNLDTLGTCLLSTHLVLMHHHFIACSFLINFCVKKSVVDVYNLLFMMIFFIPEIIYSLS